MKICFGGQCFQQRETVRHHHRVKFLRSFRVSRLLVARSSGGGSCECTQVYVYRQLGFLGASSNETTRCFMLSVVFVFTVALKHNVSPKFGTILPCVFFGTCVYVVPSTR